MDPSEAEQLQLQLELEHEGRQRASSGVSLRPFASLTRMRSRSLLNSANSNSDHPHAGLSANINSKNSQSYDGQHQHQQQQQQQEGSSGYPSAQQASSGSSSSSPSSGLGHPHLPRLARQQSYLALSIPSTPPIHIHERREYIRVAGQDDDLTLLPSSSASSSSSSSAALTDKTGNGLAAKPISTSTSTLSSSSSMPLSPHRQQTLSTLLPPLLFLLVLFVISLTAIYFAISTIPLKLPHNVSEIRLQTIALRDYSRIGLSQGLHVSAVLSALFVFKQAFSVPGSILVNILFGSLYGTYAATLCACVFTGVGSVFAYYMARICSPLVERFFPRALNSTRSSLLNRSSSDLFSYLLLARLFPLLPYSLLNIACGVLKVPIMPYFITLVLGSFPYNFVTTQLGDLLGSLAEKTGAGDASSSINAIWTWSLCFKLAIASLISAAPVIFKKQIQAFLSGNTTNSGRIGETDISMDDLTAAETEKLEQQQHQVPYAPFIPLLRRDRTDSTASEVLAGPRTSTSSSSGTTVYDLDSPITPGDSDKAGHKKSWSWTWRDYTSPRSANVSSCSTASTHSSASNAYMSDTASSAASEDSGYVSQHPAILHKHISNNDKRRSIHEIDPESGDTDEEDLREERLRASASHPSSRTHSRRQSSWDDFSNLITVTSPISPLSPQPHFPPSPGKFGGRRTASIETTSTSVSNSKKQGAAFDDWAKMY